MSEYRSDEEGLAVERQLAAIVERYGERLDEAGREEVRLRLIAFRRRAEAIRRVPLSLEDEPAMRFAAQGADA